MRVRIDESIKWLVKQGLCASTTDGVVATELGRSVSATGMLPSTAMTMLKYIQPLDPKNVESRAFALIHLACASDEFLDNVGKRFLPYPHRGRAEVEAYVTSKNGIPIRLTDERWAHITEEHCELAGMRLDVLETVVNPTRVLLGGYGELLAIRESEPGKYLVVVYRELHDDGFIITAFLTRRISALNRKTRIWPKYQSKNI